MPDKTADIPVTGRRRATRVCLLGSEGSGKTCFLAGLALLGEPNRHTPIVVNPTDATTAGFLDELWRTVNCGQWPPPTNMTTVLNMRIGLDGKAIDVLMVDYPGEDFRNELLMLKLDRIKDLYVHYAASDAILLLFDPDRDVRAVSDPARHEEQIERQMAHLQAIANVWAEKSEGPASRNSKPVDVAIIVTKSDKEPALSNSSSVRRFFRQHAAPLDEKIRKQSDAVGYFPVSIIGRSGSTEHDETNALPKNEDLAPTGYEEILKWILRRRQWRRWRPWVHGGAITALLTVILGLVFGGWRSMQRSEELALLNDPRLSRVEKLERTQECSDTVVRQRRAAVFSEELAAETQNLDKATSEPSADEVSGKVAHLATLKPSSMLARIESLLQDCRQKEEDLRYQKLEDAYSRPASEFTDLAARFLLNYPASPRAGKVRELIGKRRTDDEISDRKKIKVIRVTNATTLAQKAKEVSEFVTKYRATLTADEANRMRRAADLARKFSEVQTYKVRLKQTCGLTDAYCQAVLLDINGSTVKEYSSSVKSCEVNWNSDDVQFQWSAGQPIRVTWRKLWSVGSWGNRDIATLRDDGPASLRILSGKQAFRKIEDDWVKKVAGPSVHFEVEGIGEEDWKWFALYVFPGEGL